MSYSSPAAVAAIARKLGELPIPRCTEIANRTFMPGWEVAPHDDHVEVTVMPEDDDADSAYCKRLLAACERHLRKQYDVTRTRRTITIIGGTAVADVLEVRR